MGAEVRADWNPDYSVAEATAAVDGRLHTGDGQRGLAGVATDTRADVRDRLFIALRGERFDAHDYLDAAAAAGATALLCERPEACRDPGTAAVIVVDDCLRALGDLAAWQRGRWGGPLIAVTGSNGKTTTKQMIRAVLERAYGADGVLATAGNYNNLIGLPLTLLGLAAGHRAGVVEMGMNEPGEIARMAEIARPDVGLITCVAAAHLEGLGSIEGVARAKGEMFEGLGPAATAVVNLDDDNVRAQASRFAGRRLGFAAGGGRADADVVVEDVRATALDGIRFRLGAGGRTAPVAMRLGGRHNAGNALAAAAACVALGVDLPTVAEGLAATEAPPMRMAAVELAGGVIVVNDAYNANPHSVEAAIRTVAEVTAGRRWLVMGDMRELGPAAADAHRRVGEIAARAGIDRVVAVGDFAAEVVAGAVEGGLEAGAAAVAADHSGAAGMVVADWGEGDVVLVKGSRGSAMEAVVELLEQEAGRA